MTSPQSVTNYNYPAGQYGGNGYSGGGTGGGYNGGYNTGPDYFQGYQGGNGYSASSNWMAMPTQQEQPLNDMTALARVQAIADKLDGESTGQTDGNIAVGDLSKALADTSGKYSEEDKAAIRYMLDNQNGLRGRLDSFDGTGDGLFKVDTINKVVANPNAQPDKPLDQKMSNSDAFRTLKDHMESKDQGKMDREELSRLKDDQSVSAEVRAAAKKILENEELFKVADTGGDDDHYDGVIGWKDLDRALNTSGLDKVGVSASTTSSTSTQPVVQSTGGSYPTTSTGNPNQDYYNNLYNLSLGPATDIYRQAPGAAPAA